MSKKLKICCLPIAGLGNPYQLLMMEGLKNNHLEVCHGSPGKFFAFIRTTLKHKPDFIHVDWLHQYYIRRTNWMTWLQFPVFILEIFFVKYLFRVKIVWTLHNICPHDKPFHGPYKWPRLFFAKNSHWVRVFYKGTIERASTTLKIDSGKFKVIPEGSYVGHYPNSINQAEARKELHLPVTHRVFLYLGLIKPYKGILELIQVFRKLNFPDATLLIAGKSMDPLYFERMKLEQVENIKIIEGFIEKENLQLFYNSADLIVLPFKNIENSGSAILAMGFKKTIIAPSKGVLPERLERQKNLLYKEGQLKEALTKALYLSQADLAVFGIQNFKSLEKYNWEDFASCFD